MRYLLVLLACALGLWALAARAEGVVSNCPAPPEGGPVFVPTGCSGAGR